MTLEKIKNFRYFQTTNGLVNRGYNHGKQLKSTTFQRILQHYMNLEHVSSVVCSKTKFFWYYWPYIDDVWSMIWKILQDMYTENCTMHECKIFFEKFRTKNFKQLTEVFLDDFHAKTGDYRTSMYQSCSLEAWTRPWTSQFFPKTISPIKK